MVVVLVVLCCAIQGQLCVVLLLSMDRFNVRDLNECMDEKMKIRNADFVTVMYVGVNKRRL